MSIQTEMREFLESKTQERRSSLVKENQVKLANQIFAQLEKRHPKGIPDADLIGFCELCDRTDKGEVK